MLIHMYKPSAEHLMQVCAIFCTLGAKISLKNGTVPLQRQIKKIYVNTSVFVVQYLTLSFSFINILIDLLVLFCLAPVFFVYFLSSLFVNIAKTAGGETEYFRKYLTLDFFN
jgi:hypothetical protein